MATRFRMLSALLAASVMLSGASPAALAAAVPAGASPLAVVGDGVSGGTGQTSLQTGTGQDGGPAQSEGSEGQGASSRQESDGPLRVTVLSPEDSGDGQEEEPEKVQGQQESTGSIRAVLRLDLEQQVKALKDRKVTASLSGGGTAGITVNLWEAGETADPENYGLVRRTGENGVKYIEMLFDELPKGTYTLAFTGTGYKPYSTELELKTYSQYVAVGTRDASFTLGDVNGDKVVDEKDRSLVSRAIREGGSDPAYDLDGDGKVDITDFAYVSHCAAASVEFTEDAKEIERAVIRDTGLIDPPAIRPDNGTGVKVEEDGFTQYQRKDGNQISEGSPVTIIADAEAEGKTMEVRQINLVTSSTQGTVKDCDVLVEYSDGSTETVKVRDSIPGYVQLYSIDGDEGRKVITIDLGSRAAVKKVTIAVTRTSDGSFASVAAVEFLADIVPENPVPKYIRVHSLAAEPVNESVSLKWSSLPNITGYEVKHYLSGVNGETVGPDMVVTDTAAVVGGLDNGKEYVFEVTPVGEDGWRGMPNEVTATPRASQPPAKINMVSVSEQDAQLDISWKAGKNASTYEVYYSTNRDADPDSYTLAVSGLTGTSASLTGLTNNVTCYICVRARNGIGLGPASNIVSGTPKKVEYAMPEGIPVDALLDSGKIASVRLLDPSNVDPGTPFNVNYIIDNNYQTSWTAKDWWRNEHVECTFTEPVSLSAAIWVPRLDGNHPSRPRCYCIRVWTSDGLSNELIVPDPVGGGVDRYALGSDNDMQTWPAVRGNPSQSHFAILPFGPVENVTKIQVAVEQAGYTRISLSELMFVEYDKETDVPTLIDGLFEDKTFTKLKDTVTGDDIAKIESLLNRDGDYYFYPKAHKDELALARKLLAGGQTDGVVLNGLHTTCGTQSYGQGGSRLQPLGVTANAGDTVTVYADIPAGASVSLYATQVYAEASAWQKPLVTLESGRNVIPIPKIGSQASGSGGSLYYTCNSENADQIRLHIRQADDIPVLDVVDWYTMGEAAQTAEISRYLEELESYISTKKLSGAAAGNPKNVTEISTPSVLLSIPATSVSGRTADQLKNSILAWEDVTYICRTTQGIDAVRENSGRMAERQNIRCMQMFEGAFMYAAGSHIGIGPGSCSGMTGGTPVPSGGLAAGSSNSLFGWGIVHEIGHNMDKIGKAEITNNIYSLMVQTCDGMQNTLPSRLEKSGKYPAIFTKTARQYPGASNDVFVQLGMYWQLHLAYDDNDSFSFYNRFFTEWKKGNWGPASTTEEKVAVIASKTAGKNLTAFFEHWGMTLSGAVRTELGQFEPEPRAIWYMSDESRRTRLNGTDTGASGSISVTAGKQGDRDVLLTITPAITGRVQGYEILRDGKAIDFVPANGSDAVTCTDHVGTANNRTYTYSAIAYDMQGNRVGAAAEAGEIRIAYDATVDPDSYSITRDSGTGTVTVAFRQETQVSGLKLLDAGSLSGAYTVTATVRVDNAEKTVTAKDDDFSTPAIPTATEGAYLTWFNKPGTTSSDTRIWTYDALKLEITGLPADFPLENIRIVSYAGDEIAFYAGAEAGILRDDYAGIRAGSIVVVGTYRGDPVYAVPKIQGEFVRTFNDENGDVQTTVTRRDLDGELYLFAEIPEDGEVSDISDGIFVFKLNVEKEKELQTVFSEEEKASHCDGVNLLPSRMRAIMARSDKPEDAEDGVRTTAVTLWIDTPGGDELPCIVLSGGSTP